MPNKVTYTITTSDGKEHQVSKENVDKYGIQSYADAYKGATIRMRDAQKGDYDIPLQHFDNARKQGLHAFSLEHTPVQKQAAPKPTPTPSVTTAATPQDIVQSPRPQSQKDRPMTAVEKVSMISNVGNIVNTTQAGLQRTKNMMTYAKSKAGLHVEPVKLGKKNNVVETAKQYNPKTGKMQSHYLTEAGNEYDDKTQADIEQAAIDDQKRRELDPVQSQLEDAYSERDRLEEAVSARRKELEDEYNNRPWYQRILTEMGKASHSNVDPAAISTDPEHMGFAQDEQYMQLMSAIRKNHQTIQTLEDKKNGQMNSFWHSLGTTLANGYIFADGLPEMRDATAILNAQKHIDSINRKRKTGQALTKEEAVAEAVLRNTQVDNVVQGTYGSEYGAWARAGRGMAQSIDFMKDFLLSPGAANIAKGVAGKVAGIGGKYLAKEAGETAVKATAKTIARATLKATGVVVGAHTAGAVISNTTGIGRTVAKMGQLSAGDVVMDKNGNYKMDNRQDLMSAFAEAEREQVRENGSEMFGEFIPGGKVLSGAAKNALSKIGLGRISNMLTSIGNKAWYKNYTNLLSKGGYNGIPGEALEEYEGMFFDAITGHADEGVRDFTDPKQQVDIWLGCATMGALMGAVPMGLHIQGYYRYKQGMNKADRTADFRLTPKRWQPLKEQIDQTDNGNMAGFVVGNILNNKSLETQEKEAAMNYVRNLTKFRGFNIAQVNNADDEAKDTQIESRQQNEAYSMGYNLQDEKELNNTAILYDEAKKQATKATGWDEDTLESMIGEDGGVSTLAYMKHSDEFNDGQLQAFIDYANARAAYNGMIQRVKDDIDTKVHESNLEVEQRTNLNTGAIHPATMKVDDRQVYVVNGNVVMLPDGSGVDHEHSDDFVVLRDAKTGKLEQADPSAISKVDAPINSEEEKEAAADNIRQTVAQQQADKIDGKLEFKQGDTYPIIDKEDGTQHSLTIIGDAIDEKTGQVNPEMVLVDIDGAQQPILLPKEQVQQQVDEARRAAVAATQVVENAPTTNTNNTYSINDEVTISDENGNTIRGSITAPENEDGKFEVYTEQPINGKKVNLFSAEELDAMTKAPTDVVENTTVQQPQQQEETEESVEKEAPQQQVTALERIPKDESGQPLYEQTEPETAWDAIVEQTEGDTSMAQTVADDMVSDLETGVKKAEKTKAKSGGSIAEKIAAEKERAAVIEQAKATLAHWRKIAAVNRMREAAIQAEEQRKADEVARVRKEQEEKERVEQEEAERIKRETLNGIPDFVEDKATDARARGRSENIDGAEANQGGTEGDTGRSGSGQSSGGSQEEVAAENSHLTKKEAADFIAQMELGADVAQEIPLTIENWDKEFGEDGIVSTPIGDVKMGENQFAKLMRAGRNGKLGMLKPTLEYPDAIVEENSKAKEGTHTERPSSFIFIKSFRKSDGTRYYYFTSITVSVDGKEVVVSNQEKSRNRILRLLMEGSVIWRTPKDATTSSAEKQGLDYVHPDKAEGETKGSVITPQNTPSVGKDSKQSDTKQEKSEETAKKDAVSEDLFAKAERVAEEDKAKRTRKKEEAKVDTNPTEAQKEAGNYKKGHIKVDGFNVTIEQPKGSIRRGKDANGKEWESEMHNTYGYIRGTESVDGDHIDIFLSDNPTEGNVFVVDQVNKDGSFDEHKVMYGFSDMESARKAYLSNYEEGWQGLGNITEVSKEEFKKWIDSSKRKTKPFAEYSSVKTEGDVNVQHPIENKGSKRLVSNERYEELKKRMRSKLGQLNLGVDPEMLAIGAEMAVYHIENGARAFGAYAKEMISDLGDAIRPYLKAFYNGARDLPEMTELSKDMTPYDEVSRFDVATIGNDGEQLTPSAIETAEQINNEATVEFNAKQEQSNTNELEDVDNDAYSITKQHNNKKDVDIWVVRGKERTDKDVYTQRKQVAKEHNGYYSSFRGVNGFVFNTAEETHAFADAIFNTQSEENPAHNSEKVHKAIDAYEDAQEKFDNLFSLLVKEKESKPFDTREWREVNRTKEELKDVLLQLNTKELGELLKQVSGKDTEYVIKNVLDIVNREEHRLIAFNAILDKQSHITPEYKEGEKAIPVSEFVETDKKRAEIYTILTGVFHDKGYVVGTDAYLLLARKEDYDKSLEGKVTNKKGEVINGKYPNWRAVVNSGKQGKSWGVNLEELHAFTRGVLTKLKTEKANPSTKKDAKIAFKTADGKIVLCYANALDKALQGAKSIGAKSFFDKDDVFAITQTPKGYVICPMLNQDQNIDDNSFAYVPRVSELQHSTETLSNDTEAKQLATDGLKIHQAKKSQKESKDSNVFLSHKEYIEKELVSALKQTKYKTLEEWEDKDTENYAQKYDDILETYEDYVRDLADDEKLQAIYDKSSVKTQKEIREYLTDADLDYHEFINTSPKRLRIQDRLTRKSKYAKGEFSDGTIVSGEVVRWSPTSLTVNSRGTLYTISANKVLEQSNEPMNADGHEYQENGPLQYSTEDLTNNTTAKQLATDTILSALNKAGIEVVRATDEQAQELLANTHATSLRTPQGTIYGWAVDGKIYLTEAGINPDTPIHEYTYLWAEAMKTKNKKGWNSIKALLKETPVWNEVVADPNYSNIMNDEDAVASEVLSRISGRENAARMESEAQKVIDEDKDVFEKAKSVTLLNRIKRALDMFWKWVGKELFKIKKFGSINEVTDRVLYDLVNGTDLNGVRSDHNDDIRYRDFYEEVNEQFNRELAGLTEENADTKIFNLGSPSSILLSAGVEDKPMKLYGNKIIKKMKKHGFALAELQDLPRAVANPIAVFNNYQREGNRTILTELRSQGKNIMVAITLGKNGVDVDFNIVSSVFGKRESNVVDWINKGYLTYINKEKALNYLYFSESSISEATDNVGQEESTNLYLSAPIAEAAENSELSSAAKIVKDFVNPNIDEEKLREGYGSYTNTELSLINDPVAKMLGKSNRSKEDHKAFAERERQRMISRISELADRLHLDNIEAVTDSNSLQGKKTKSKGFYSKNSGKITIVIPNHASVEDVEKTLLHEAVAHYGLRKLFGEHFETFLDNVYQNVEPEIRRIITSQAANNNWDFRTATEEYLAGLAERTDFERVHYAIWNKIKSLFLKMLHSIGFEGWSATELSDNELRYLLWRSYENLKEPGRYRSILGEAEDIAKQNELKVGNYDQQDTNSSNVAGSKTETENTLYRQGSNGQSAYDIYENAVKDSGTQTMLGALARTVFSKDARTRFKNKFAESYFDYSRSIKQLQDAIEDSLGVKLDSYEDVWRTLNAKGSADAQEVNLAMLRYIAPLAEYIGYMIKGKSLNGEALTLDDVEKYMNAVHGIERNKHMQEAAFRDKLIKKLKSEGYSNEESEAIAEAELDNIRKGNGSMYMDIYDNARKDYSGLTALFGDEVEDVDNIDELEAAATQYANDFGKTVGMDKTLELWDKVRALNDFSLRKSYLSGLISKAQYEGVKQMYQYYVPLRGWHEGAAGDIYEYISRGERAGMLESALKVAKGRKSRAGDILGTMAAMANTAIVQGNRNLVAQKFLNMALNYGGKSGLLMVGKQWYEESANEELIPLFPNLHDGMTVQEQQDEIERFEKDMEEKRKAGRVRELRKGFNKEVGLRMPKWQEQEHCVRVLRNGREHQVYVLGNPRAAQAFNGLLNKQAKSDILRDAWAAWMRAKATMQTSLSPEFIFSNFQRDILTAGTGTYIKFGRKAGVEFAKNLTMLNPMAGMSEGRTGGIFTLIHRYNNGTLDKSNEVERMFDEFVRNGGMTGVSVIEGKDEYQKSINKAVKRIKQGKLDMGRQAIHGLADAIEFMNSGVENSTRFAAYMVSRKTLGKSVTESVFDAKEASVNFNMKGSGAWLNLWMRRNIMYANPAIQSLRMLGTWYEASPKRFMGVLSTIIATSVTMAMLWASIGAGDGDDDNDWYKLSEWNRYNYLNVWTGNGYAHWSLPQEFRPVWALGQIVFDWQRGMVSKERAINSMMTQLNNLSPMAFFSGGMDSKDSYWKTAIRAWTPTIAADFSDAYVWNENFLGQKITNQEDYNIDSPEFQRAGKNTPHWAVSLSKQWNNGTGGAENRKSYWDSPAINPSALYYLAQQQLGGLGTMVTKLSKAYEQLEDPNGELEAKNIPFVSKVWVSTEDKQSKNRVTDDKFWMIYNDWKLIDSEMKHNKSDVEKGKMSLTDLAERMNELQQNGDHKRWARLRGYMKGYDELRKARNNGADVEEAMDELKKDVVKEEEKTLTNK